MGAQSRTYRVLAGPMYDMYHRQTFQVSMSCYSPDCRTLIHILAEGRRPFKINEVDDYSHENPLGFPGGYHHFVKDYLVI